MPRLVMNLHALHIRRRRLTHRTRQLRMSALIQPLPVHHARLTTATVRRCRVDLGRDLLGRVLLRLRLPRHPCLLSLLLCPSSLGDSLGVSLGFSPPPSPCSLPNQRRRRSGESCGRVRGRERGGEGRGGASARRTTIYRRGGVASGRSSGFVTGSSSPSASLLCLC
ncbi:hypothetical protein M758_7G016600 [Ceratodon purpureus]|nr:hypothetical protein M758_7G016600 [Ceratodon purpureus]